MKYVVLMVVFMTLLTACQKRNALHDDLVFKQTIPVCNTQQQCDAVWQATGKWMVENSEQGIAVSDDLQIVSDEAELGSDELDIKIMKIPLGGEQHQILIDIWCNTRLNTCNHERQKMLEFNRLMSKYISEEKSEETLQIFALDSGIDNLFHEYIDTLNSGDLNLHAGSYHLPATIINGKQIVSLTTVDDVLSEAEKTRQLMRQKDVHYLKPEARDMISATDNTAVVNVVWGFYDVENVRLFSQRVTYNLLKPDQNWKILTVSVHSVE